MSELKLPAAMVEAAAREWWAWASQRDYEPRPYDELTYSGRTVAIELADRMLAAALAVCEVRVDTGIAGDDLPGIPRAALVRRLILTTPAEEVEQ